MSGKVLTTKEFIDSCKIIHAGIYDYSKVKYVNAHAKVTIGCYEHGDFEQLAYHHKRGVGCPTCHKNSIVHDTDSFIKKAEEIHPGIYDYSKTKYDSGTKKLAIICKIHGEFLIGPQQHIKGSGCKKCNCSEPINNETLIQRFIKIHGTKYDYSKVSYNWFTKKVVIICKTHGDFKQNIYNHINGNGCPKCSNKSLSKQEIINKFNKIHNNKFSYEKMNYVNTITKITITCPICGDFSQTPLSHTRGNSSCKCVSARLLGGK